MTLMASVLTARLFEFYTRWVWPVHRWGAKNMIARRCRRCALSQRAVPLDAQGFCRFCVSFQPPLPGQDQSAALSALLSAHEGRGQDRYDALLLFSGGKDSVYMARRIQTEHPGLRLLALTIDNTFMSPVARANVLRLVAELELDHIVYRPARSFFKKLYRHGLTHLGDRDCYNTVDFSDGEFIIDSARLMAAERRIPLLLCGYSFYQVQNGLGFSGFESSPEKERVDRTHVAGMALADIFTESERALWWRGCRWPPDRVARIVFPLFAWNKGENEILQQVADWGLLSPRENSPLLTNHQLIPLFGVVDVHRLGYSGYENEFCRMIREGKASFRRWRAIFEFFEYTAQTGFLIKPIVLKALRELDLTPADLGIRFSAGSDQ